MVDGAGPNRAFIDVILPLILPAISITILFGFMASWTEFVLACHHTDEDHWRERPELAGTESPRYVGRAVVALAADPAVMARSGRVWRVGDLATEYGFTDIDGRRIPPFELDAG